MAFDLALYDLILGLYLSGIRLTKISLAADQQSQSEQILNIHFSNFYENGRQWWEFAGLKKLYVKRIFL